MLESRALFQVAYREFDDGVATTVGVESDGVSLAGGNEDVVAVGQKECGPGVAQLGATNDEWVTGISGFGDPGLAVQRVVDPGPGVLADLLDSSLKAGVWRAVME